MKLIKIPFNLGIDISLHFNDIAPTAYAELAKDLFGRDAFIESVRFGVPFLRPPAPYLTDNGVLVLLVDEDGVHAGQPFNPRASLLYRGGDLHDGVIVGDAYVCEMVRNEIEGDMWDDIPGRYTDPSFWIRATAVVLKSQPDPTTEAGQ